MTLIAAADGSALGNPGPAGWAWYIDADRWASGGWPHGTNNMGELTAVLDLLRQTAGLDDDLLIYCDSQYVINSITKWMAGWKRRNWRKGDGKPVLNVEIMKALDEALQGRRVRFEWVKGHSGHPLNEEADRLANGAAVAFSQGRTPPPGPGIKPITDPARARSADGGAAVVSGGSAAGAVGSGGSADGGSPMVSDRAPGEAVVSGRSAQGGAAIASASTADPDPVSEPCAHPAAVNSRASAELEGVVSDPSAEPESAQVHAPLGAIAAPVDRPRSRPSSARRPTPPADLGVGYSDDLFSFGDAETSDDEHVVALERSLLTAEVRADPSAVAALLHPDWYEIGQSGRLWTRSEVMATIGPLAQPVVMHVVRIDRIADDAVLLVWRCEGTAGTALRTSLWVRAGGDWVQRFQQGTTES